MSTAKPLAKVLVSHPDRETARRHGLTVKQVRKLLAASRRDRKQLERVVLQGINRSKRPR